MSDYAGDVTPQQAWEAIAANPAAVLIDVRTSAEWRWVGVPDTASAGKEPVFIEWVTFPGGERNADFVKQLADAGIEPGAPLYFLCRSGQRSIGGATAATAAGYGPAHNVLEGFEGDLDASGHRGAKGWRAAGLPWRQS